MKADDKKRLQALPRAQIPSTTNGNIFALLAAWKTRARRSGWTDSDCTLVLDAVMACESYDAALETIATFADFV